MKTFPLTVKFKIPNQSPSSAMNISSTTKGK